VAKDGSPGCRQAAKKTVVQKHPRSGEAGSERRREGRQGPTKTAKKAAKAAKAGKKT
jgi:hypothetical protein